MSNVKIVRGRVVYSDRILERTVVNDAVVGEWTETNLPPGTPPTYTALASFLRKRRDEYNEKYQSLEQIGFDEHLFNYGQHFQYWIPTAKDLQCQSKMGVCVMSAGVSLTEGRHYQMKLKVGELVSVVDDDGNDNEFLKERFKSVENSLSVAVCR